MQPAGAVVGERITTEVFQISATDNLTNSGTFGLLALEAACSFDRRVEGTRVVFVPPGLGGTASAVKAVNCLESQGFPRPTIANGNRVPTGIHS